MNSKTLNIIGWVLTGLLGASLILSAFFKLSGSGEAAEKAAEGFGLTVPILRYIGVIELVSLVLFIIPRTGVLGTLLLAAYLGGAIATHLEHHEAIFGPIIFESLIWITAVIRFPELLTRIKSNNPLG